MMRRPGIIQLIWMLWEIEGMTDAELLERTAMVLPTLDVSALRGKDLICFCKPKRCHCDPILIKANR